MTANDHMTQFNALTAQLERAGQEGAQEDKQTAWADIASPALALWQAEPANMRFGLLAGAALLKTGRHADGVALLSKLSDQNPIIRTAQYQPNIALVLRQASRDADIAIREAFTHAQQAAIERFGAQASGRIRSALWPQTHAGPVPYPKPNSGSGSGAPQTLGPKPYVFFAPDLPHTPVFSNASAPWTKALSANVDAMRDEFLSLMKDDTAGAPYVPANSRLSGGDWDALRGQTTWNAVHLFQDGEPQEAAKACPMTVKALQSVPLVMQNGHPMEVFFSVLKPGVTIPPHFGLANCRVTVHVPLIIPKGGAIRVADITHEWGEGEPFIFDDSFDHSAWNGSETDMRVVLIFEAWRPDMTEDEIGAVEASYAARRNISHEQARRFTDLMAKA